MLLSDTAEQENQPCSNLLWGMKKQFRRYQIRWRRYPENYDISELISYNDQNKHIYRAGIVDNITVFHSYPMDGIDSVGKSIYRNF